MTITDAKKRYHIATNKEMTEIITQNIDAINADGEHYCLKDKKYCLDEVGVERLDDILGYASASQGEDGQDIKDSKLMTKAELELRNSELETNLAEMRHRYEKLRERFMNAQDETNRYKSDYDKLALELVALQEGHGNMSTSVIRNLKRETESLRTKLERSFAQNREDVELRDTRIRELEERIDELQNHLTDFSQLQAEKLKTEHELLASRKEQDRLLRDLRSSEGKINSLESDVSDAQDNMRNTDMRRKILIKDVDVAVSRLMDIVAQLQKSSEESKSDAPLDMEALSAQKYHPSKEEPSPYQALQETEEAPEAEAANEAAVVAIDEKDVMAETANTVTADASETVDTALHTSATVRIQQDRDAKLEAARKEQEDKRKKESSGGLLSFLRDKAASFF